MTTTPPFDKRAFRRQLRSITRQLEALRPAAVALKVEPDVRRAIHSISEISVALIVADG